jgi:hypothetical protein
MKNGLKRVFKQVKLSDESWDELFKDFLNGESRKLIQAKYNLTSNQYKYLKKYIYGKID